MPKPNPDLKTTSICQRCGKQFEHYKSDSKPRKYCSKKCHDNSITGQCAYCKKEFRVFRSLVSKGKGKYCSKECSYNARREDVSASRVDRLCARCGKPTGKAPTRKYCSTECLYPKHTAVCQFCGKEFTYNDGASQRKYCSTSCSNKSPDRIETLREKATAQWMDEDFRRRVKEGMQTSPHAWKRRVSGENHPLWKGGKRERSVNMAYKVWRKTVLSRDHYKCQHCGTKDLLQVHHIKPWKEYPELRYAVDNGIVLCENCHNAVHGRKLRPAKTCAYCGNEFKPSSRRQQCCSRKCANALRWIRRMDRADEERY